jgi:hypothetical protein
MNASLNAGKGSTTNNTTDITRCAMYIRTGVPGEVDYRPPEALQKERLEAYAAEKGWTISKYYEDKGFSGFWMDDRPALKRLMADAEKGRFDCVLVLQIERLAERIEDFTAVVTKLAGLSIEVISITQPFDTSTPAGRLICGLFAILAEWEKKALIGDEPLECSMIWGESNDTPVKRFIGRELVALLQFEREQNAEYTARSEVLLHGADLQRKGAQ